MKTLLVLVLSAFMSVAIASGPDVTWTQGSSANSEVGIVGGAVSGSLGNGTAGNETGGYVVNESYGGSVVDDGGTATQSGTYSELGGYSQGGSLGSAGQVSGVLGSGAGSGAGFAIESGGFNP